MTEETEVNPLRAAMVHNIIAQHYREPLTVEALAPFFPADFDLGEDDLAPHIAKAAAASSADVEFEGEAPQAEPATELPPQAHALAAIEAEPEAEPEIVPATPEEIEAAVVRRNGCDQTIANARVALLKAQSAERAARDKLSKAVVAFQSGFDPITSEILRRNHVREAVAIRAAIKNGTLPARPGPSIGKSVVDRMAFYGRGGSPARGDYRRGAFPSQMKGGLNRNPARGPTTKLPSDL